MNTQLTIKKKSDLIVAEIDSILHHCASNPEGIGYLDILRIIDRVNQQFSDEYNGTPKIIEGSMDIAKGLCSPKNLDRLNFMRKGIGTIVAAGGGSAVIWGILTIMAGGVTTVIGGGILGGGTTVLLLTGPFAILGGVFAVGIGMYYVSSNLNPKQRALKAHEIIRESIIKWGLSLENKDQSGLLNSASNVTKKVANGVIYSISYIFSILKNIVTDLFRKKK